MKKLLYIMICFLLILSLTVTAYASPTDKLMVSNKEDIKDKLAPYQAVIDKINKEYSSSINIPEDGLLEVFNNVKDMPLDKFEADLRRDYEMVKDSESDIYVDAAGNIFNERTESGAIIDETSVANKIPEIVPDSVIIEKRQYCTLSDAKLYLDCEVESPTGSTFYYSQIYGHGSIILYDRVHFRASSSQHEVTDANTICWVGYYGSMYTSSGVNLLVVKNYYIDYNANY